MSQLLGLLAVLAMLFAGCAGLAPTSAPDAHQQTQDERRPEAGGGGGGGAGY